MVRRMRFYGFQSTHPIRGATTGEYPCIWTHCISIHAPHTGCDYHRHCHLHYWHISIHAPHTGCDNRLSAYQDRKWDFNPRTPYGVRRALHDPLRPRRRISIHAPHTGCDGKFDDFNPLNLHKRYKRVLDRPKSTSEQGKNKAKLAYIHVFTVFDGCEGAGTVCALLLRTQYC